MLFQVLSCVLYICGSFQCFVNIYVYLYCNKIIIHLRYFIFYRRSMTTQQVVNDYLFSPSSRRFLVSDNHCHFCQFDGDGTFLEAHLKMSNKCRQSYLKILKLRNDELLAIMIQLYSCIRCASTLSLKLKPHILR